MSNLRKPTQLKIIHGTFRPTRTNAAEPQLPPEAPPRPTHLSRGALAEWDRLADQLLGMRILTRVDGAALELLACAFAEARELESFLRKHGRTYQCGVVIRPRPEVAMLQVKRREVARLLGLFGLTPTDRSRVNAAPPPSPARTRVAGAPARTTDADEEFT
jgi:P27 family predicted phage terminase small subunit